MKYTLEQLIEHANVAIEKSKKGLSKLSDEILRMEGMSGHKTRHLYNNICSLKGINYLEIGTWKGSSFISSLYHNDINAIVIDNWKEFDGPKIEFLSNVEKFCSGASFKLIEADCFKIEDDDILKVYDSIDVYLYDGAHDYDSQKKAITYYSHLLSKYSIIIIDDFRSDTPNWANVKKGTYDGIAKAGLKVHYATEIITYQELSGASEYWNGFGLFICERTK